MAELDNVFNKRVWAEIDLDALENNYLLIRSKLKDNTKLCCVVKANAYGHGSVEVAKHLEALGADHFAVATFEEAVKLRKNGIKAPILILGYTPPECAKSLSEHDISQCVYSLEYGASLADNAKKQSVEIKIHIKLDTGMGRIGFSCRERTTDELEDALVLCKNSSLIPIGIFSHFAVADDESQNSYTHEQFDNFNLAIDFFNKNGIKFDICHTANSAGIFLDQKYDLDMARAGIVLYGLLPSYPDEKYSGLLPVMSFYSVISHIKTLKKGQSVSYGRRFCAERDMKVATVAIGYADGLHRCTSNSDYCLTVSGKPAKILGRICMDQLIVDVSDIDCKVGDTVTIFDKEHTADQLALETDTISYEIVSSVSQRVPRIYIKGGKVISIIE